MNFDMNLKRITMTTNAAERLYRIAFTIPPQASNHPQPWTLYTIKLPVPTTLNNAQLLLDIIQITPAMLRTEFYRLVEPKLHLLIKEWQKLPERLTLLNTYMYPVARMALVNVALLIHLSFPTVGQPQEVLARPAFSLSQPADLPTREQQAMIGHRLNQAGAKSGWKLYQHLIKFDEEMMRRALNEEKADVSYSTPPAPMFAVDPHICFMPVYLETKIEHNLNLGR